MDKGRAYIAGLALGYQISQVLFAAHNLRLFAFLEEDPGNLEELARRCGADRQSLKRLLQVLLDLQLIEQRDDRYYNAGHASSYLVEGRRGSWVNTIHHASNLWWFWEDLDRQILSGKGKTPGSAYLQDYPHRLRDYLSAMEEGAAARAGTIASAIGIQRFKRMLDIGCGPGTYALAFAEMNPSLLATVLDLKPSLDFLQDRLSASGSGKRISCRECEVLADAIPGDGYDLVFISNLIHLYAEDEVELILAKAWNALACSGEMVIHDYLLGAGGEHALYASLFDLTMLVGTPCGRCYSTGEVAAMFERLHAAELRVVPLELGTSLMIVRKREIPPE